MQILITIQNDDGTFPPRDPHGRGMFKHIQTENAALALAIRYAQGRGFKLELFRSDSGAFSCESGAPPFKTIEQPALPFPKTAG
jgi:hypothetical protein